MMLEAASEGIAFDENICSYFDIFMRPNAVKNSWQPKGICQISMNTINLSMDDNHTPRKIPAINSLQRQLFRNSPK